MWKASAGGGSRQAWMSTPCRKLKNTFSVAFFYALHDQQWRISAIAFIDSRPFLLSTEFMDNNIPSTRIGRSWDALCRREDIMSLIRHFDRLQTLRDQLEAKLDLDDAGFSRMGYRARCDLRERITEISQEISALERSPYFQS